LFLRSEQSIGLLFGLDELILGYELFDLLSQSASLRRNSILFIHNLYCYEVKR
jgi:hypothetical protein